MSREADQLQKEYYQRYREKNRQRLTEYKRKWRSENPDKTRQYNQAYWERKVQSCVG